MTELKCDCGGESFSVYPIDGAIVCLTCNTEVLDYVAIPKPAPDGEEE